MSLHDFFRPMAIEYKKHPFMILDSAPSIIRQFVFVTLGTAVPYLRQDNRLKHINLGINSDGSKTIQLKYSLFVEKIYKNFCTAFGHLHHDKILYLLIVPLLPGIFSVCSKGLFLFPR